MNLDDILNDVDLSAPPSDAARKPAAAPSDNAKKPKLAAAAAATAASTGSDLDAILDDVVSSNNLGGAKPETDVDAGLKIRVVAEDIRPWLAASANVPKDFREKWTKMAKIDVDAELTTKFQPSYAYRSWDGPAPAKNGINRSLQEIVRKAALLSGLDEAKSNRLLTIVNPVTDSENGKQLQLAYAKQLLEDFAGAIKQDSNYSPTQFAALAAAI